MSWRGGALIAAAALAIVGVGAGVPGSALAKERKPTENGTVVVGEVGKELEAAADGVQLPGGRTFWGAVLVARDGKILFAKGYGMADYEKTPNTPATLFELASVSKQVTATAVLHLAQRKKLSLDDSIAKHFDKVPDHAKAVTVRHLVRHTSGLSSELGVAYSSPISRDAYVKQMLAAPLAEEPGTVYQYSNVGYALLAALVEEVTGKSFEEYVEKHLFKPAKMKDSGFVGDKDLIKSDRVSTRRPPQRSGDATAADWHWGWGYRGMGGVVSTVLDLHLWDRALRDGRILKEAWLGELHAPGLNGYGGGWNMSPTDRGGWIAEHSGGVAGYGTFVRRYLDDDALIVVLGNHGSSTWAMVRRLQGRLFHAASVKLRLQTAGYEFGEHRVVKLPDRMTWSARRKQKGVEFTLHDDKREPLVAWVGAGPLHKLTAQLEIAIATRRRGDDGSKASMEAGFYLGGRDPRQSDLRLDDQVVFEVEPQYRGRAADGSEIVDERVLLRVEDAKQGGWPFMAKMNVAAAEQLLEALRKAAPK